MAYLEFLNGPGMGWQYKLSDEQTTIGRHPDCQVVLRDLSRVGRRHAQIERQGEHYYLLDLKSRNGTFHNNERIDQTHRLLREGDVVRICDVEFVFRHFPAELGKHLAKTIAIPEKGVGLKVVVVDDDEDAAESRHSTVPHEFVTTDSDTAVLSVTSLEARMTALVEIARNLGKVLALNDVLPKVMESLLRVFEQADRGFIVLKNERGELVSRAYMARSRPDKDQIRISRTIVRHVMEMNQAILTRDAMLDERLSASESIAELKIRSMMCAPLVDSEGAPLGIIEVDTLDDCKPFRKEDLEVLTSVAVQAGIAIDNAKMHEAVVREKGMQLDLAIAHEIQHSFLPQSRPEIEGYEFFDYYHPAAQVGGDYYDYIPLPDGRLGIVVADVAGHEVAAAMLMARLSGEMISHLENESQPATAFTKLNSRLAVRPIDRFVTALACVLDPAKHEVTIVIAGHMLPIWRHTDGTIEEPGEEVSEVPLGVEADTEYQQITISLEPGEWLVMYTDGISEARNPAGDFFTIKRIRDRVREADQAQDAFEGIVNEVRQFAGERPHEDDMCLVCLRRI